jgi:hypothetical protein
LKDVFQAIFRIGAALNQSRFEEKGRPRRLDCDHAVQYHQSGERPEGGRFPSPGCRYDPA